MGLTNQQLLDAGQFLKDLDPDIRLAVLDKGDYSLQTIMEIKRVGDVVDEMRDITGAEQMRMSPEEASGRWMNMWQNLQRAIVRRESRGTPKPMTASEPEDDSWMKYRAE